METQSCSIEAHAAGGPDVSERFLAALVHRDFQALAGTLALDAKMRMLLPRGPQEETGNQAIAGRFARWFGDYAAIELLGSELVPIANRTRISWRFRVTPAAGSGASDSSLIEQVAYVDCGRTAVRAIDLVCSGFLPDREWTEGSRHSFDAGELGCADGLAEQFRGRIEAIAVGDRLEVLVSDPAAKSDLPALARMLGHLVLTTEARPDERLAITVEKRR
jgi:TusA-related sulfurtransferase